jgi:DNA polymerase-3 subunit beta
MRVTIERGTFLKSLNHVQSVVERRNTIPILSNVLLQASDGALKLTATDLDIEIVEQTSADIGQPGSTTVPAHMLYDIVRKLPDGAQLQLEQGPDEGRLAVIAGRSRFSLQALPPQDFPDLASGEATHSFTIAAADLKQMIDKTRFAISTEETGIISTASTSTLDSGAMRAVATDGHRLARVELPAPEGAAGMPGVIVPRKTVLELAKLIEDEDGEVAVSLSASKIRFEIDQMVLTSKLIDGTFPDYERVIPANNDKQMDVDTRLFAQAVDRVSTISSEKGRAVNSTSRLTA